jgi:hypothetical protein
MAEERINDKILEYTLVLEARYPPPFTRYLLGTPTTDKKTAVNQKVAPKIPPGTYAYPDTVPIDIGTILYSDAKLEKALIGDENYYRHLFTSLGDDAGYVLSYDAFGVITFYELIP